jgi:hypothetical protein
MSAANDGSRYAMSSILSSGKWVQIKVTENAVYKLTYEDLKKFGFDNPAQVKVYGYGGWLLNEDFSQPYTDDIPEVSVYVNKGADGIFSAGDFFLFYGRGTVKWTYNSSRGIYEHQNNYFSTYGSYFLKEDAAGPKEMLVKPSENTASITLTVFDDYLVYEKDNTTISYTGRELFGESFLGSSGSKQFSFSIPGITSDAGNVKLSFASKPSAADIVALALGNDTIVKLNFVTFSNTSKKANMLESWNSWNGEKSENTTFTVSCHPSRHSRANLNHITLNMKRLLQFYNTGYTFFRNRESIYKPVTYNVDKASANSQIWDITGNYKVNRQDANLNGTTLSFSTNQDNILHEYVMVDITQQFPTPQLVGEIANQDLHALPQTDMIILAPTMYLPYAETLAERHRAESLNVTVVDDKLVFNEFSSGTPDGTAYRRFVKMFYDRAIVASEKPRYLLLFGDGIFDNRHLTSECAKLNPQNFLLTYQMKESLDESYSYGTDDYFGFLDDSEGLSVVSAGIDLGIGRLPVSSTLQASNAVNKILNYMNNSQAGNWKSKIIFTADNTDSNNPNDFCTHAKQADALAQYIDANHPEYMQYKYFMDAYKAVNTSGNTTYPEAKKGFLNTLKEGCFLLNYTGHGSTKAWSSEDMINITDIRQMDFANLPLWITATCDFGWYDGVQTSAGEEAFLNKNSGAIALYTTSRVVYQLNNFQINQKLIKYLFEKDASGAHLRLGDVLRQSKLDLKSDGNKLNYVLLGDPALRLNYPEWKVEIETVNGEPVDSEIKNFRALDNIAVRGIITDESGIKSSNFSGNLEALVFDSKKITESTVMDATGDRFTYSSYPNQVFLGSTAVTNGEFEFSFTVPKDISYTKDNGKMIFYAADKQNTLLRDASGYFERYSFYGTNEDVENDGIGPEIKAMYLNTESFTDGDAVNPTPFFFASVFDEDGVNFSGSGIGHDIKIFIDNKWEYNLNQIYDIQTGIVGFSIPELPDGEHRLRFRVWDIMNNYSEDSLTFRVVKGYKPEIIDLTAYGNPALIDTRFVFKSNLPETALEVIVNVYDLSGQTLWTVFKKASAGMDKNLSFEWDLTDTRGFRVNPGVYIYRAMVKTAGSTEVSRAKKIIVLKQ